MTNPNKFILPLWQTELDETLKRIREAMRPADEAAKRWRVALRPVQQAAEQLAQQIDDVFGANSPFGRQLQWIAKREKECEALETAGWMPHRTSPFDLVESTGDAEALSEAVHAHYRDKWQAVSDDLRASVADCDIDDEAKATFDEALAAHGSGLYRCAPRLLFPEIERISRIELHGGSLKGMSSQPLLRELMGKLSPADMASSGVPGVHFYRILTKHLYAQVKEASAIKSAQDNAVPNRHAALHGIVPYRSEASSLNAIFIADYVFHAISVIKHLAADRSASQ